MRYVPTIHTSNPELLSGLQPGQWINYEGAKGRYMGRKNGCVWIAWNGTAAKRFHIFARAFRSQGSEKFRIVSTKPLTPCQISIS